MVKRFYGEYDKNKHIRYTVTRNNQIKNLIKSRLHSEKFHISRFKSPYHFSVFQAAFKCGFKAIIVDNIELSIMYYFNEEELIDKAWEFINLNDYDFKATMYRPAWAIKLTFVRGSRFYKKRPHAEYWVDGELWGW